MAWYFINLPLNCKAPAGKNKIPQHDQWGLTIVEIDEKQQVSRYLHEDGGWFTIREDFGAPIRPMIYATVSGANKALKASIQPNGDRGPIIFAVYTAQNCEDPRGKASLISKHLSCQLVSL